jgi:hypothetical protein
MDDEGESERPIPEGDDSDSYRAVIQEWTAALDPRIAHSDDEWIKPAQR